MANLIYRMSRTRSGRNAELLVRFYHGKGIDQRGATGIFVPVSLWSDEEQHCIVSRRFVSHDTRKADEANAKIAALSELILQRFAEERYTIRPNWLERIIAEFNGTESKGDAHMTLAHMCREYGCRPHLSPQTKAQYEVVANLLDRYAESYRTLYADTLTHTEIDDFVKFLKSGKEERCQNTVNAKLRKLRAVCRWCVETDRTTCNPFTKYKIQEDILGTPVFLTIEERDALYQHHFSNKTLERQRDIFIFQCHVGCRVSDLLSFTRENVSDDGFLQYIQHKMARRLPVTVRVPLSRTALEILDKYSGECGERLLPFISAQKYNDTIKVLLREAGITRPVMVQNRLTYENEVKPICDIAASHLARRTFMANMYKRVKDARIVSSFTGHVDGSHAFARYTDVDDEMKREIIKAME